MSSSRLLSEKPMIEIYKTIGLFLVVRVLTWAPIVRTDKDCANTTMKY